MKKTCKRGHKLSGDNLYERPYGDGGRSCRTCRNAQAKARRDTIKLMNSIDDGYIDRPLKIN